MYTISDVAKLLGITAHTLRYYEKEEIIAPIRNANGERVYDDANLAWLRFVMKLKQTQIPISQIREYAQLYVEGEHTTQARLSLLENHRNSVQSQIRDLTATEKVLKDKIAAYKNSINNGIGYDKITREKWR
ncbi:MerR family transcriptional regulator [Paenibacillus marchantiophytorum]|uniref:MerR family transcriptional regulator n=1 Tax=Paenibacillus marchantiophytorum TaxID=1619310 RepID=A0ABQ1EZ91_9BACL|nr:MerR family transcriptional regulator [Paenibacillus marchantiophytorum]GFZ92289.1 MerR family transcriptional regulator [Paenibacillus marchantiophytorum]